MDVQMVLFEPVRARNLAVIIGTIPGSALQLEKSTCTDRNVVNIRVTIQSYPSMTRRNIPLQVRPRGSPTRRRQYERADIPSGGYHG